MHEYVESSLPMFPHIHNIASQTMSKVYFETFQSLQLTNIVILQCFYTLQYMFEKS